MRNPSTALLIAVLGLAATLVFAPARADEAADHAPAVTAATQQAEHWLDALDRGDYDGSWNNVAAVMRVGRHQEDWISDVAAPRAKLGKPIMRELKKAEFSNRVRGAPEGNYVLVRYLSQFADAPPTYETILLTLEGDQWHIGGYDVEPASAPAAESAPAPASPAGEARTKPGN